jgi:hypothetical protein
MKKLRIFLSDCWFSKCPYKKVVRQSSDTNPIVPTVVPELVNAESASESLLFCGRQGLRPSIMFSLSLVTTILSWAIVDTLLEILRKLDFAFVKKEAV